MQAGCWLNQTTIENEALTDVWAISKFCECIEGCENIIATHGLRVWNHLHKLKIIYIPEKMSKLAGNVTGPMEETNEDSEENNAAEISVNLLTRSEIFKERKEMTMK